MDRGTFVGAAATTGAAAALSAFAAPAANTPPANAKSDSAPPAAFYAGGPDPDIPKVGLRWPFSATVFFADRIMIQSPNPRGHTSGAGREIGRPRRPGRVRPASG